jgi:FkbM family methyltransferase
MQSIVILTVRPYVIRELPGWGKLHALAIDYRRDWLWAGASSKTIRGKLHGYIMHLDLSKWSDRSTYFLGRWYDLQTQLLISDLIEPGDTVVDVGANRGNFALIASRLAGNSGRVICFEPNPNCLEVLDLEIASNQIANISINRVGLGDRDEVLTLSVPAFNSGEGSFGLSPYREDMTYQIRAHVKRGDQLLADERPSLMKIDVEGFECNVIAGLAETINRYHPIILTEVAPEHLTHCGASVAKLVALMEGLAYKGFKISLRKEYRHYYWQLTPLKAQNSAFDAVWLHSESIRPLFDFL